MSTSQTSTVTTNELKLYDTNGTKASITYGDANIDDGYSYLNMNIRANDKKVDLYQDKPILNFIAEDGLTLNDKKVWHEDNDGPMSGLNADMLDGKHATEFKDRQGHHHFNHAFTPGGSKMFVKIATLTPKRVGNAPNFSPSGNAPYQGIFASNIIKRMEARAKFEAFVEDTPDNLSAAGVSGFEHTDMATEGVFNATLRASISLLRSGNTKEPDWKGPETMDIHLGLFEDPTNTEVDGWACTSKYFYLSCHNRNLPFIKAQDDVDHDYKVCGNEYCTSDRTDVYKRQPNTDGLKSNSPVLDPDNPRPDVNYDNYAGIPDCTKNDYHAEKFPKFIDPGFAYRKEMDVFRLYHAQSYEDTIDGVKVVKHRFELYMAVDTKSELHIQPFMSSSCVLYNYQKPLLESELPDGPYLRPTSIYDDRYASVEHRHRNYEYKMEQMDEEIEQIWNSFDSYVQISQGGQNGNKILMTNNQGEVVLVDDNFERHKDSRRSGNRVVITNNKGCIIESKITVRELESLEKIRGNVQNQIDNITNEINAIPKLPDGGYVKKSGDTMFGNLKMIKGKQVIVESENGQRSGSFYSDDNSIALWDNQDGCKIWECNYVKRANKRLWGICKNEFMVGGHRVTVGGWMPSNPEKGDVWIKNF